MTMPVVEEPMLDLVAEDGSAVRMPLSREEGFEIKLGDTLLAAAQRFVAEHPRRCMQWSTN
jgi:hypothetical protein